MNPRRDAGITGGDSHLAQPAQRVAILADESALDNLLDMNVAYLIAPKADGMRRQTVELERRGYLGS